MYSHISARNSVEIELDSGVYELGYESSNGKTYLCKLLKDLRAHGEPVDGYTFNDKKAGRELGDYLTTSNLNMNELRVILLDRYDMYNGQFGDAINKLSNHCTVLIDCKNNIELSDIDIEPAWVELTEKGIKVSQ